MKKLLLGFMLLLLSAVSIGQNIAPTGANMKLVQNTFYYFTTDSTLWLYKNATYGWTKVATGNNLQFKIDSVFQNVYNKSQSDTKFQTVIATGTSAQYFRGDKTMQTLNTDAVPETASRKYYTDALARAAISLTTTGTSGAATYDNSTGILNIPAYTLAGLGGVSLSGLSGTAPIVYNSGTGNFSITNGTIAAAKLVGTDIATVGTITSGTWQGTNIALNKGGTNNAITAVNGGVAYSDASKIALTAAGAQNQVLISNGANAPSWVTPDLTYMPDAAYKKSVKVATTANITLSAPQTIDGIAVVAGDRVLVKDQTTPATNGIYIVQAAAWTRAPDADAISEIAGGTVNVDQGTQGGWLFSNDLKATDVLGTTVMPWYRLVSSDNTLTLKNKTIAAGSNTITGLTNANLSGSAAITNANLANSSVTVGTTPIALGASSTTLAGLTSVTATTFTGALSGNATTATTATNTTVTDDNATNATVFPLWKTANTGNLPDKTSSTKLTFNPSTGVLNATNLTGTNTGDETNATIKTKLGITTLSGSNTGDQTITLTGDVTGSGTGSFSTTLATVNSNVGTFNNVTVNGKGLVTAASNVAYKLANDSTAATGFATNYDLGLKANSSLVGAVNGIATLDASGKVPLSQINSTLLGSVNYIATWNATTNIPALPSAAGVKGNYYVVTTAGTYNSTVFNLGDWVISDGTNWAKVDNNNAISSVFGRTGNISATAGDYNTSQVTESGNLYYTDTRARASNSAGTGISYNSSTGVITNSAPDQTVSIASGLGITVTGTYPSFTATATRTEIAFSATATPSIASYTTTYGATYGQNPRVELRTVDASGNYIVRSEKPYFTLSAGNIITISFDLPFAETGKIVLY